MKSPCSFFLNFLVVTAFPCFSILFLASHPNVNTWLVFCFAGPSSGTHHPPLGLKLHSFPLWSLHVFKRKRGSACRSQHRETNSTMQSSWCISYHLLYSSCSTNTGLFQKVPCTLRSKTLWRFWGPWHDSSSNQTSSFKFLLWFSHGQIEPGNSAAGAEMRAKWPSQFWVPC